MTHKAQSRPLVVHYFAAAQDAAGISAETITTTAHTVGHLRAELAARHGHPLAALLEISAFLIGDEVVNDPATELRSTTHVDVLPPFAGG